MGSTGKPQTYPCSCNKYGGTDCVEFKKIVESQDGGLDIYRYEPEANNDVLQKRIISETCEAFIIRNSMNAITREDLKTKFDYNQITCPRCIKIVKHAASLVTSVQLVDRQEVLGVCDHCRMKERCRCNEIVEKFKTNVKKHREVQRQSVKKWLTQVQHLLKDSLIDDSKGRKLKRKRARSEVNVNKLFSEFNKSKTKYDKEESRAGDKIGTSVQRPNIARTSYSSEILVDANTDVKEYLNRVIKPNKHRRYTSEPSFMNFLDDKEMADTARTGFSKIPKDKQTGGISKPSFLKLPGDKEIDDISKLGVFKPHEDNQLAEDKLLRDKKTEPKKKDSFLETPAHIEPKTKRKQLSILKISKDEQFKMQKTNAMSSKLKDNSFKATSEQDVSRLGKTQEFTSKSKTSPSSEMPWLKGSSEQDLSRDFSFLFPKEKIEIVKKKRNTSASSADLIKDLQDTLKRKAEEEKTKKEEELKTKREKNERKKLEREEKIKMDADRKELAAKQTLQQEKRQLTEKLSHEKADEVTTVSSITSKKGEKEAQKSLKEEQIEGKENEEFKRGKEAKLQKQILGRQENPKKDKHDILRKETDSFKQDKKSDSKIAAQKLTEKEAHKPLKEKQKKEKEEEKLIAKTEKLKGQETSKREKAEKSSQILQEKETFKKNKDTLQNDNEGEDKSAKTESDRKHDIKNDTSKKDQLTKKNETTKRDEMTKKDETNKNIETTKKDEIDKEPSNDKKDEEDKQAQRAANDALKALLSLQGKEKADREKLKKQQELEIALAEKKAKEAEKMDKEAKSAIKHVKNKEVKERSKQPEEPPPKKTESPPLPKDLSFKDVKVRHTSPDDLILRLVKLKQTKPQHVKENYMNLPVVVIQKHGNHKCKDFKCALCRDSELELDYDECLIAETDFNKPEEITDIIIGEKIYKGTMPYTKSIQEKGPTVEILDEIESEVKKDDTVIQESPKETVPKKPLRGKNDLFDPDASKGVIRYALSDRSFIDKGWTMLPTEKVVRKMNVYRMRPAHPEFDWFEHNKLKRLMQYDTGEKLAEFDDNGRGRWFYRSGKLALDYYDAEEINAQQRFVVYSSGEPDERGRTRPRTILATFDYLGNGIVFDHAGKIRLKYNQTEGVVLDRSIGPVSQWKWHTLNDPPVLQQVMIDTQMPYKDPTIMKLGGPGSAKKRVDNEEMLAIEFDNFIKEKSRKLTQKFKPFQIRMKALKINEYFSLRVLDQATVYLIYRDGTTNLKINMGMILDHKEIVDTDTADVGDVSNSMERLPARTDSLAVLQQAVAQAQREERSRVRHEQRLRKPADPCASAEQLTAAASRPLRPPLVTASSTTMGSKCPCKLRKPPSNFYYDTRL